MKRVIKKAVIGLCYVGMFVSFLLMFCTHENLLTQCAMICTAPIAMHLFHKALIKLGAMKEDE